MSEQTLLSVSDNDALGKVEIAPEVIEVIAGIAAAEVKGLYAMRGNFASGVAERLGKKPHSKGVKVELTESGVTIDLCVILHFGVSIPLVAQEIQTNIRQTLINMTAIEIEEINIHVVGIQMEGKDSTDVEE
ncbi:Asp23/Gls24 family envelope stress response protein [Oceanobacillus sp. 143]|uniref:Asp23/Gls24 family envelope stress response protein n=1 Tax=Oceanobacillus zhaokaii TaxID=2052660 RepID=A0A345PHE6_9BACI|nr:Asp23/Gls24 family envelope stress response protein [Oceanobacillus zhaokaii]AXI09426.1 Asp23/Gls24 family envelope stress response protein [Oceanobacillus zhaokaii]QGS68852.1 Asp23/Gls24 family envelope stress response protein [Oceanobacillus sp. 143]